ncbi:MAG: hypothetical protein HRT47_11710 [Candidatus Caenarcaniphilales bacterium]|nr:hypothetical protein [Candidatus Caenarcaniphilales bacterium]
MATDIRHCYYTTSRIILTLACVAQLDEINSKIKAFVAIPNSIAKFFLESIGALSPNSLLSKDIHNLYCQTSKEAFPFIGENIQLKEIKCFLCSNQV